MYSTDARNVVPPRGLPAMPPQLSHWLSTTLLLPFTQGDEGGYTPECHSFTFSLLRPVTQHPKSMGTLWVCKILVTMTQVISGHHLSVNSTVASLRLGSISPYINSKTYSLVSSLLGIPALMSGLAVAIDAPLSVVNRHDLSPIHPMVFRLSLSFMVNTQSV